MNNPEKIIVLKNIIQKNTEVLEKLERFYDDFIEQEIKEAQTKKQSAAIVIADILVNYYTCVETIFLRISQFFENNLSAEKWHQDLLDKMVLELNPIRERVIGNDVYYLLRELLKFRHFKRYYFQIDYDWDKLEYLQKKFSYLRPLIKKDLAGFQNFLNRLIETSDGE
jgi:hypothetical protein